MTDLSVEASRVVSTVLSHAPKARSEPGKTLNPEPRGVLKVWMTRRMMTSSGTRCFLPVRWLHLNVRSLRWQTEKRAQQPPFSSVLLCRYPHTQWDEGHSSDWKPCWGASIQTNSCSSLSSSTFQECLICQCFVLNSVEPLSDFLLCLIGIFFFCGNCCCFCKVFWSVGFVQQGNLSEFTSIIQMDALFQV